MSAREELRWDPRALRMRTVGAVIAGSLTLPGEQRARRIVCKVIKPEAERGLRQELQAFDSLAGAAPGPAGAGQDRALRPVPDQQLSRCHGDEAPAPAARVAAALYRSGFEFGASFCK